LFKEQFGHAWTYKTEKGMREFIQRWRRLLNWSRLKPLIEFYDMLMRHIDGVVAWARHRLTNAALEGNNSRVRAISQRAHGYRNPNNLMANLCSGAGPTPASAAGTPVPVQPEAGAVPTDDRLGLDEHEDLGPPSPEAT
jgi:hypothetical protein